LKNSSLAIEAVPNDVIREHEFVEFLLKISVLKSQQVSVVLKRMQLLLKAVANLVLIFIAALDGFEFATVTDKLTA
jgi:hypothetical protein